MQIRRLTAADIDLVARLEAGEPSAWDKGDLRREIEQRHAIQLVAVDADGGRIVGWCCSRQCGPEAELLKIAVLGRCRRSGIAAALLASLEGRLVGEGVRTLFLEVRSRNHPATSLYRKHGFSEVGRRPQYYSSPEDDAVILAKTLAGG